VKWQTASVSVMAESCENVKSDTRSAAPSAPTEKRTKLKI